MAHHNGERSDAELGELAAFADGSLAPAARGQVARRMERSPELRALVEEQRRAIRAIQTLDARAPASLRSRLDAVRPAARRRARLRGLAIGGGLAAAVAVAAALVVVLGGGDPAGPTLGDAVEAAQRGATEPAPPPDDRDPNLLAASVSGVVFPDYSRAFDWRAFGERSDELDGRGTRTVYYRRGGHELAYTIVSGEAVPWPEGVSTTRRDGVELRSLASGGLTVVTWLRDGHTCVLSGEDLRPQALRELAAAP